MLSRICSIRHCSPVPPRVKSRWPVGGRTHETPCQSGAHVELRVAQCLCRSLFITAASVHENPIKTRERDNAPATTSPVDFIFDATRLGYRLGDL